jgi:tetratricopeptide (TPR) repeat protein
MNRPASAEWWRWLFRRAVDNQPSSSGGHVSEDDELLACWAAGHLSRPELADLLRHLGHCAPCRREIAALIREGVLELPDAEEQAALPFAPRAARGPRRAWRTWMLAAAAVAAVILPLVAWRLYRPPGDTTLATAERDLDAGRPAEALDRLERWLDAEHPPAERERALGLLERAGAEVARDDLVERRFDAVQALIRRLADRGVASARLTNLELQAERGIPAEFALAQAGMLTDYGYTLAGSSLGKDIPDTDPKTERLEKEWQQAVRDNPKDASLRLNYGQFLLSRRQAEEAKERFREALRLGGRDALARLGWGLAAYDLHDYAEARQQFEALLGGAPDDVAGHVNLAMCLEQLGQGAAAREHWQRAAELTGDEALRGRIRRHLER